MTTTTAPAGPARTDAAGTAGVDHRFYAADDFDFAAKVLLGHAARGVIDVGLVLATLG